MFSTNSEIFQLYCGENKLIFNKMMMRSALYQTNTLSWMCIVLSHCNNSPRIDMTLHSDTIFRFRAKQSFLLLTAASLVEKQPIPLSQSFGLTRSGLELTIYHTRGEHADNTVVIRISKDAQTIQWLKEQSPKYVYKIVNRKKNGAIRTPLQTRGTL